MYDMFSSEDDLRITSLLVVCNKLVMEGDVRLEFEFHQVYKKGDTLCFFNCTTAQSVSLVNVGVGYYLKLGQGALVLSIYLSRELGNSLWSQAEQV